VVLFGLDFGAKVKLYMLLFRVKYYIIKSQICCEVGMKDHGLRVEDRQVTKRKL